MMNAIILLVVNSVIKSAVEIIKIIFNKEYGNNNNSQQAGRNSNNHHNTGVKRILFLVAFLILGPVLIALFENFTPSNDANATKVPSYSFEDGKITCDDEPDLTITSDNCSIEDVILISGIYLYTIEELMDFSRDELRLIRNGIFALNGRAFVEEDLHNYYSQFDWYNPLPNGTVVDYSSLSEYQRKNVDLIKEIEAYKRKFNLE